MSIPRYSFADYKRIAAAFLKKHGFPLNDKLPVDIEVLIDKAGVTIHPVKDMFKDFGVKGAVLKTIGGFGAMKSSRACGAQAMERTLLLSILWKIEKLKFECNRFKIKLTFRRKGKPKHD